MTAIAPDLDVDELVPNWDGDVAHLQSEVDPTDAPDGRSVRPHRSRWRPTAQIGVLAVPVIALAVLAWTHRSMFVDGYIYLHVVQNVLAGHGPVFNAGQRVEAFTSPLWTFVLSVVGLATPFPLDSMAVTLGILLTVAGAGIAVVSSSRLVRRVEPTAFLLPVGMVVFVALSPVWSLASLGLETGLTFFWLGCCLALLVRWSVRDATDVPRYGLIVLGLGPLVRPELGLDSLVFVGVVLFVDRAHRNWRRQASIVAWAGALPLAYQVFRMGYYGMVVANTAVAKEAGLPRVGRGIAYFADFVGPYWMFVPAAALVFGAFLPLATTLHARAGARRSLYALVALPVAGTLNAVYITVMGGDYVHARLLVAPLFAICAPIAAVPLARRYVVSLLVVPWAALCATTFRSTDASPWSQTPFVLVVGHGHVDTAPRTWEVGGQNERWLVPGGIYVQFNHALAPVRIDQPASAWAVTPEIATSWIGTEPYRLGTGVRFLDLLGLANPLAAHLQLVHRGLYAGHEKPLPTPWVAALLTGPGASTAQLSALQHTRPASFTALIPDVTGHRLAVETAWARAALDCPTIRSIEFGPERPLTVGTFLGNIVHSMSQTTVRIPADPETAYHRFCGPGTPASVRAVAR